MLSTVRQNQTQFIAAGLRAVCCVVVVCGSLCDVFVLCLFAIVRYVRALMMLSCRRELTIWIREAAQARRQDFGWRYVQSNTTT